MCVLSCVHSVHCSSQFKCLVYVCFFFPFLISLCHSFILLIVNRFNQASCHRFTYAHCRLEWNFLQNRMYMYTFDSHYVTLSTQTPATEIYTHACSLEARLLLSKKIVKEQTRADWVGAERIFLNIKYNSTKPNHMMTLLHCLYRTSFIFHFVIRLFRCLLLFTVMRMLNEPRIKMKYKNSSTTNDRVEKRDQISIIYHICEAFSTKRQQRRDRKKKRNKSCPTHLHNCTAVKYCKEFLY